MGQKECLTLCMGSACHQQGIFDVLKNLKQALLTHNLQDTVEIKGSFCFGECGQGVVMEYRGKHFYYIRPENVVEIFEQEILPRLLNKDPQP
jgi:NADH:ubiquinone oxidoreductase subunit E